ncbi:hypothetical protein I4U23_001285 [Adineta vaga]|nr:hypothetical protein I4U23_001285 [Adineta vaga]
MSEVTSLNILIFGVDNQVTDGVSNRLRSQGIQAESLVISNTQESDTEIERILRSKDWNGLIVGHGVRQDQEWFERIMNIVNTTNPNVSIINTKGPDDVENAIERYFNV